jgi:putative aminopeptidase FrvX
VITVGDMNPIELLEQLSNAFGPSGHEDDVRDILIDTVKPLTDEVRVDRVGNVIATRRGSRDDVLLLDAHTDEVGFLVAYVEDSGFLRLSPLGGWDARVLPGHALTVRGRNGERVRGVIGTLPPHITADSDRTKAFPLPDLFVDIGAGSRSEASDMGVDVGCGVVPGYTFERVGDDLVMGKAFDDRAGCTVAVAALDGLQGTDLDMTLVVTFTTSEEVGLRGARTVADQVLPAVAIALEGTTAVDVPGVSGAKKLASMGRGPAVTIADSGIIASRQVTSKIEELAKAGDIPYQMKLPGGGGTNAAAYQPAGRGALVGVIAVPVRYIHAPLSLLKPSDLDAAVRLTSALAREASSLL